jgi:hypothetical protein
MLWIAARSAAPPGDDSRKSIVMAACACARTALEFVPAGELCPLRAIETAEAWCAGRASLNEVRGAAYAAAAAAPPAHAEAFHAAASAALTPDAASLAADAASLAADAAALAAASAALAADAAAFAFANAVAANAASLAAAAAALAAGVAARAEMAPVVRRHLKCPRLQSAGKSGQVQP